MTGTVYKNVVSDIGKGISLFLLFLGLVNVVRNYRDFQLFYKVFIYGTFFSSVIISLIGLYKLVLLSYGVKISYFFSGYEYPWGTSLVTDYNFFSLGLIIGLLCGIEILTKYYSGPIFRIIVLIGITFITLSVIFSGSRRGFVVVIFITLFFLLIKIYKALIKSIRILFAMRTRRIYLANLVASFLLS